jgi:hypothetical protein
MTSARRVSHPSHPTSPDKSTYRGYLTRWSWGSDRRFGCHLCPRAMRSEMHPLAFYSAPAWFFRGVSTVFFTGVYRRKRYLAPSPAAARRAALLGLCRPKSLSPGKSTSRASPLARRPARSASFAATSDHTSPVLLSARSRCETRRASRPFSSSARARDAAQARCIRGEPERERTSREVDDGVRSVDRYRTRSGPASCTTPIGEAPTPAPTTAPLLPTTASWRA